MNILYETGEVQYYLLFYVHITLMCELNNIKLEMELDGI
jgi:hypothetical protein